MSVSKTVETEWEQRSITETQLMSASDSTLLVHLFVLYCLQQSLQMRHRYTYIVSIHYNLLCNKSAECTITFIIWKWCNRQTDYEMYQMSHLLQYVQSKDQLITWTYIYYTVYQSVRYFVCNHELLKFISSYATETAITYLKFFIAVRNTIIVNREQLMLCG